MGSLAGSTAARQHFNKPRSDFVAAQDKESKHWVHTKPVAVSNTRGDFKRRALRCERTDSAADARDPVPVAFVIGSAGSAEIVSSGGVEGRCLPFARRAGRAPIGDSSGDLIIAADVVLDVAGEEATGTVHVFARSCRPSVCAAGLLDIAVIAEALRFEFRRGLFEE